MKLENRLVTLMNKFSCWFKGQSKIVKILIYPILIPVLITGLIFISGAGLFVTSPIFITELFYQVFSSEVFSFLSIFVAFLFNGILIFLINSWSDFSTCRKASETLNHYSKSKITHIDSAKVYFSRLFGVDVPQSTIDEISGLRMFKGKFLFKMNFKKRLFFEIESPYDAPHPTSFFSTDSRHFSYCFFNERLESLSPTRKFFAMHEFFHGHYLNRKSEYFSRFAGLIYILYIPYMLMRVEASLEVAVMCALAIVLAFWLKFKFYPSQRAPSFLSSEEAADRLAIKYAPLSLVKNLQLRVLRRFIRGEKNFVGSEHLNEQRFELLKEIIEEKLSGKPIKTMSNTNTKGEIVGSRGHGFIEPILAILTVFIAVRFEAGILNSSNYLFLYILLIFCTTVIFLVLANIIHVKMSRKYSEAENSRNLEETKA